MCHRVLILLNKCRCDRRTTSRFEFHCRGKSTETYDQNQTNILSMRSMIPGKLIAPITLHMWYKSSDLTPVTCGIALTTKIGVSYSVTSSVNLEPVPTAHQTYCIFLDPSLQPAVWIVWIQTAFQTFVRLDNNTWIALFWILFGSSEDSVRIVWILLDPNCFCIINHTCSCTVDITVSRMYSSNLLKFENHYSLTSWNYWFHTVVARFSR